MNIDTLISKYDKRLEDEEIMELHELRIEYALLHALKLARKRNQFPSAEIDWFRFEARLCVVADSPTEDMNELLWSLCKGVTLFWEVVNNNE